MVGVEVSSIVWPTQFIIVSVAHVTCCQFETAGGGIIIEPEAAGDCIVGSPDMSHIRKASNYSKWEKLQVPDLRAQAKEHQIIAKGVSFYKMDGNKMQNLLCVRPHRTWVRQSAARSQGKDSSKMGS